MITNANNPKTILRCAVTAGALAMLASRPLAMQNAWPVGLANYRDAAEVDARLVALAANSAHTRLYTIGSSIDYHTDPNVRRLYSIRAIRVSESTNGLIGDDIGKNSILFEAGSHPREWLSTESALALAEHLVNNAERELSGVPELLRGADVWIIPLTTVAGRVIDDREHGDPRAFSTDPESGGWRGNGDTRGCDHGVNVARNFSTGWTSAPSIDCVNDPEGSAQDPIDGKNNDAVGNYRGFAPFSTLEAVALRQFVQNHSISMAVVMHSNAQEISNLWGGTDAAGIVIANRARAAFNNHPIGQTFPLALNAGLGSGVGQFSAWLAQDSNTPREPDMGTTRRIQTIFVELPITTYTNADRFEPGDGSNGFHPSSAQTVRSLQSAVVDMGLELIRDAKSPGCVIVTPWSPADWQGGCPQQDFGFVGAKIGRGGHTSAGLVTTNVAACFDGETELGCPGRPVPARDVLNVGSYTVYYRVQNFSLDDGNDAVDVQLRFEQVEHFPDGDITSTPKTFRRSHTLATQEGEWGWFAVSLLSPNTDYTMTLDIVPRTGSGDNFPRNNRKVFKLTTPADSPQ